MVKFTMQKCTKERSSTKFNQGYGEHSNGIYSYYIAQYTYILELEFTIFSMELVGYIIQWNW